MIIPNVLLGEPHLPIRATTSFDDALKMCSDFYEVTLDSSKIKRSQPIINNEGYVILEIIDIETNTVLIKFVNKTLPKLNPDLESDKVGDWEVSNPLEKPTWVEELLDAPLTLVSVEELVFLNNVTVGEAISIENDVTDSAYSLARLLNEYGYLGRWVSGTFGELSTAGFTLIYKGSSQTAPGAFQLEDSDELVLIKINQGTTRGFICLRT